MRRAEKRRHCIHRENQQKDGDVGGLGPVWRRKLEERRKWLESRRQEALHLYITHTSGDCKDYRLSVRAPEGIREWAGFGEEFTG